MSGDVSRLPKWARNLLAQKDRDLETLQRRVESAEALVSGAEESSWSYSDGLSIRNRPMPANTREVEWASEERGLRIALTLRSDGLYLWMNEGRHFAAQPQSSNVMKIVAEGYLEGGLS